MTGNRSNRSGAPGEKPVINEKIETYTTLDEDVSRKRKDAVPAKAHDAGDESPEASPHKDSGLKKGLRLFNMKRWEDALQEFLLVVADNFSNEERAELAYYMGLCCAKLERFDDALLYLEQVIIAGGDLLRVYQCRMILAFVYLKTNRAKMAEAELNRLLGGGFESVPLYNTLAYAAYAQKHYVKAIELYEKALDLDGDNITAMNSLGYILADQGLDTLRGMRLCRKAVEKNPQNAAYLDSLGWALYKSRRQDEAVKWLRQAADIAPQEKEIKEHFKIVCGEVL